jgi:hypothetical protein
MDFFYLLSPSANTERRLEQEGGLSKSPTGRIVSVEDLEMGNAEVKNDEILLTAKFVASTFRQDAPEEAALAAPKKATEPAKKGGVREATEKREQVVESKSGAGDEGAKRLTNPQTPLSPK